ncbi:MAG: cbb3-type cytochrome oxidase assembly protein CcoS [Magnetococcales bacterium]|nr:cbb3-type cytochrome oxidase assembly protein CcoS [Magnetococcales bacterium]
MDAIYLLLPLAVLLSLVALGMMIWSVRRGQFDDLEGPAHRILFEDDREMVPVKPETLPVAEEQILQKKLKKL